MLNDLPASLAEDLQGPAGVPPELATYQDFDGLPHHALHFTERPLVFRPELSPSKLLVLDGGFAQPDHPDVFYREAGKNFKARHHEYLILSIPIYSPCGDMQIYYFFATFAQV